MAHQATAPENHWSQYYTADQAAECLSYFPHSEFGKTTPERAALSSKLWNDIGPEQPLHEHWGVLTEAEQKELETAYINEYEY
ncbi:hypothetical protein NVP1081O_199 [Vibrio phage 1.081.O._10N.286.52.C2]|nr:hypothetical protein NVP1081O_199 [Vibrio phage 1.081.O._10N.286.52.C2]